MNKQQLLVPLPLAKLAKESDFDEECLYHYWVSPDNKHFEILQNGGDSGKNINSELSPLQVSAPLYQQLIDWLREEHLLVVTVIPFKKDVWVYEISSLPTHEDGHILSVIDEMLNDQTKGITEASVIVQAEYKWGYYQALEHGLTQALIIHKVSLQMREFIDNKYRQ